MDELLRKLHDPSVLGILLLSLVLVADFVVGSQRNLQLATRFRAWARGAFPEAEGDWAKPKSAGFQAVLQKPPAPFRRMLIRSIMLSREILPLWLLYLFQGKRDILVVEASVRRGLKGEVEVFVPGTPLGRKIEESLEGKRGWARRDVGKGLVLMTRGEVHDLSLEKALSPFVRSYGESIRRVSFRRKSPQTLAVVAVDGLGPKGTRLLFRTLERIGKLLV
jgi:hypothetical protein